MRKVLVTGGSGFIGGHVIDRLLRDGIEPLVLDHAPTTHKIASGVVVMIGDVRDATAVTEAAAHVDGIIHLAAVLGTQETIQNPRPSAEINILGGLNVFEAATQYDLPVVYAGVGNYWMRAQAAGSYTISKTVVEDYSRMFNAHRGSRISVVRPVNAYGRGQSVAAPFGTSKVRKIIPSFTARALTGRDVEVYGDGEQISDCVHVSDVANAFVTALRYTDQHGPLERPAEVGPASSVTVNEIARQIVEYARQITGTASTITHLPMRPGEVPGATVSADIDTLLPLGINAHEFTTLEWGLSDTVEWYANRYLNDWTAL